MASLQIFNFVLLFNTSDQARVWIVAFLPSNRSENSGEKFEWLLKIRISSETKHSDWVIDQNIARKGVRERAKMFKRRVFNISDV